MFYGTDMATLKSTFIKRESLPYLSPTVPHSELMVLTSCPSRIKTFYLLWKKVSTWPLFESGVITCERHLFSGMELDGVDCGDKETSLDTTDRKLLDTAKGVHSHIGRNVPYYYYYYHRCVFPESYLILDGPDSGGDIFPSRCSTAWRCGLSTQDTNTPSTIFQTVWMKPEGMMGNT